MPSNAVEVHLAQVKGTYGDLCTKNHVSPSIRQIFLKALLGVRLVFL